MRRLFVARTGYTGEDGFEILLPADVAESFWERALQTGIHSLRVRCACYLAS